MLRPLALKHLWVQDSDLRKLDIFDEYNRDGVYSSESPVARPIREDKF